MDNTTHLTVVQLDRSDCRSSRIHRLYARPNYA